MLTKAKAKAKALKPLSCYRSNASFGYYTYDKAGIRSRAITSAIFFYKHAHSQFQAQDY